MAGASYAWAMGLVPPAAPRQLAAPEAMLVRALLDIGESRFSSALEQIDNLLASNPNFRLAQLVKGDLLIARSRPINSIGNASGAPSDEVDGLRQEARARLARYQIETPRELAPRYLLQMPQKQKYALVLDSAKSTLFVFENTGGAARYVADYYVTIGKNGMEKLRRRRQAHADRRLSRGQRVAEGKTHRFLRQRRIPNQLSERVGPRARA